MDRKKYCNELNRETFLSAIGFQVISFAFDDVAQRPDLCITLLRMVLGRYLSSAPGLKSAAEREIVRLACALARPLRPVDVEKHLGISHRTSVRTLQSLCGKGVFSPVTGANGKHVVRYVLQPKRFMGYRKQPDLRLQEPRLICGCWRLQNLAVGNASVMGCIWISWRPRLLNACNFTSFLFAIRLFGIIPAKMHLFHHGPLKCRQ
jgi:hypothetical protein